MDTPPRDRVLFVSATQEHSNRVADDIIASVSLTDASRCEFTTPAEYVQNVIEALASTAGTAAIRPVSRVESLQNVMESLDALRLSEEAAEAGNEMDLPSGDVNSTTLLSYRPKPSHEAAFCNAFLNYYQDLHGMGVLEGEGVHRCAAADRVLVQLSTTTEGALHRPLLRAVQVSSVELDVLFLAEYTGMQSHPSIGMRLGLVTLPCGECFSTCCVSPFRSDSDSDSDSDSESGTALHCTALRCPSLSPRNRTLLSSGSALGCINEEAKKPQHLRCNCCYMHTALSQQHHRHFLGSKIILALLLSTTHT